MLPVSGRAIHDGAVLLDGNLIAAVGPADAIRRRTPHARERDLGRAILLPGFVDTHCHLEWSLTPGAGCTAGFATWLDAMIGRRDTMTDADFLTAARAGARRALTAGTTLVLDAGPTGAAARAADEVGLRAIVHLEAFGRMTGEDARAAARAFAAQVAALDGELVRGGVSPHAPYTVGPDYWRALLDEPSLAVRPWMSHVAESPVELPAISAGTGELADVFTRRGWQAARWPGQGSVIARLGAAGVLRPGLVAAHCVQLDPDDPAHLAREDVRVAHCPVSNDCLGVGRHPLATTRGAGLAIGLGSDSPASQGDFDVRAVAAHCAETTGAGAAPEAILRMATIDGARVAGMADRVGTLEAGKLADVVAVDVRTSGDDPDPVRAALDPANPVVFAMVDGRVVVDGGELVKAT